MTSPRVFVFGISIVVDDSNGYQHGIGPTLVCPLSDGAGISAVADELHCNDSTCERQCAVAKKWLRLRVWEVLLFLEVPEFSYNTGVMGSYTRVQQLPRWATVWPQ